jgi:hypothetical protein
MIVNVFPVLPPPRHHNWNLARAKYVKERPRARVRDDEAGFVYQRDKLLHRKERLVPAVTRSKVAGVSRLHQDGVAAKCALPGDTIYGIE